MKRVIITILLAFAAAVYAGAVNPTAARDTKAYSPEDSIRRLHAFQSDKEKMLLYQIKKRNGTYVLDLTKEDAKELNIPDSLYLWATQVVESLNKED